MSQACKSPKSLFYIYFRNQELSLALATLSPSSTSTLIKKFVKKNDFIIVGSSMGAWLALKQFQEFKKQIKGFLGIGSAPVSYTHLTLPTKA